MVDSVDRGTPAVTVNTITSGTQQDPAASALDGGGYVIVWEDRSGLGGDNSSSSIKGQRFDSAGNKIGGEFLVNTATEINQDSPSVAGLPGGGFVVTWTDYSNPANSGDIKAQLYAPDGSRLGGEFIVNATTSGTQLHPSVTTLASGEFVVSWWTYSSSGGDRGNVVAQRFAADGTKIGSEFAVNTTTAGIQSQPEVVALPSGGFAIFWNDESASTSSNPIDVRGQIFDSAGQKVGAEILVNTATFGSQFSPRADVLSNGNIVVGYNGGIQILDQNGNKVGAEITTTSPRDVAALPDGGFVVVQDGFPLQVRFFDNNGALVGGDVELDATDVLAAPDGSLLFYRGGGDITASVFQRTSVPTEGADVFIGTTGADDLAGSGGNDRFNFQFGGNDRGDGGAGDDVFAFGGTYTIDDVVNGGSGTDVLELGGSGIYQSGTTIGANLTSIEMLRLNAGHNYRITSLDAAVAAGGVLTVEFSGSSSIGGLYFDGSAETDGSFILRANSNGSDTLIGGAGNDELHGSSGDLLRGGAGNDVYVLTIAATIEESAGGGTDQVLFAGTNTHEYRLPANVENFSVTGSGRIGQLYGNSLNNVIVVGATTGATAGSIEYLILHQGGEDRASTGGGADVFYLGGALSAGDEFDGGAGIDELILQGNHNLTLTAAHLVGIEQLTILSGSNGRFGFSSTARYDYVLTSVDANVAAGQQLTVDGSGLLASEDLSFDGSAETDGSFLIRGGTGSDRLVGGAGNDMIYAGPGRGRSDDIANDYVDGGGGDDFLFLSGSGTGGDDVAFGGSGNDAIYMGGSFSSGDRIDGGAGSDDQLGLHGTQNVHLTATTLTNVETIVLLSGSDRRYDNLFDSRYDYGLSMNDANVAAGEVLTINGSGLLQFEDIYFDGSAETDGAFRTFGGMGSDVFIGGAQNDGFFFGEGRFGSQDQVHGGGGSDNQVGLRGDYSIDFTQPGYSSSLNGVQTLVLISATDPRYLAGSDPDCDYSLTLGDGLVSGTNRFTVNGAGLHSGETMVVNGSGETSASLRLIGGAAGDTLTGGGGNDEIFGNLGADILSGNGGADAFIYTDVAQSRGGTIDRILDFSTGTDKIDLSAIDANSNADGNQAFTFSNDGSFHNTAGELRTTFDAQNNRWVVEGDVNGDGIADFTVHVTTLGNTPLGSGDFIF